MCCNGVNCVQVVLTVLWACLFAFSGACRAHLGKQRHRIQIRIIHEISSPWAPARQDRRLRLSSGCILDFFYSWCCWCFRNYIRMCCCCCMCDTLKTDDVCHVTRIVLFLVLSESNRVFFDLLRAHNTTKRYATRTHVRWVVEQAAQGSLWLTLESANRHRVLSNSSWTSHSFRNVARLKFSDSSAHMEFRLSTKKEMW